MHTGVQALLLAAVTALPFTPPPGWVQLPQSAVGANVSNVWKGPKRAEGAPETFSAVVFPFFGTLDMLASRETKAPGKANIVKTVSNQTTTLCGIPARLVTLRVQSDSGVSLAQHEDAVRGGYAYILMYTRQAGTPASPAIGALMRNFCPSGSPVVGDLNMPAGWTKSAAEIQMAGMWAGTQPGQFMSLMRATQMSSLDDLFASAQKQSSTAKSKETMKITAQKAVTMCGHPGMLADMEISGPLPAGIHMALTQADGAAYVLAYVHMGSAAADPAALASLQTLCAVSTSPMPSAPPMPSESPSLAPSAAATSQPIRP